MDVDRTTDPNSWTTAPASVVGGETVTLAHPDRPKAEAGQASDIYSLVATLYYLATGRPLLKGCEIMETD